MTKYITALILILTMNQTQAAPVTISWSLATERENGDALYLSEIKGTNIWFYISGSLWGPFIVPLDFLSMGVNASPDEFCVRFSTVLLDGPESEPTEWLCLTNTPEQE